MGLKKQHKRTRTFNNSGQRQYLKAERASRATANTQKARNRG